MLSGNQEKALATLKRIATENGAPMPLGKLVISRQVRAGHRHLQNNEIEGGCKQIINVLFNFHVSARQKKMRFDHFCFFPTEEELISHLEVKSSFKIGNSII